LIYDKKIAKFAFLCFSSFCIALVFALRGEAYGLDIVTYYQIFNDISHYQLDEPGLTIFNNFLSFFSTEYFWFSFSYSSLITFLCSYLYWKLNDKVALFSLFILISSFVFFQMQLNIYRQSVSVLLVLIAFLHFRKNLPLSVGLIVFACLFHKAALFGVIIIFIARFHLHKNVLIILFFLSFVPFGDLIFISIANLLSTLVPILSNSLDEYSRLSQQGLMKASGFDHRNLPVLLTLFLLWFWQIELKATKEYGNVFLWCYLVSIFFASIFSSNVLIYDRIIIFAQILQPLFFCEIIYQKFKQKKLILYFLFIFQLIFTLFIWGPRNFVPEITFLSL
jgi:hypothetical protein